MSPRMQIGEVRATRAAKLLNVRIATMYRWCREGRILARRDITGHYFVQREVIDEILRDPELWRARSLMPTE